jgi:hypothetical protein
MILAIFFAASNLFSSRKTGDWDIEIPNNLVALASPVALIIIYFFSYYAYSTKYFALSAIY